MQIYLSPKILTILCKYNAPYPAFFKEGGQKCNKKRPKEAAWMQDSKIFTRKIGLQQYIEE